MVPGGNAYRLVVRRLDSYMKLSKNKGAMLAAADIIRRSNSRSRDLVKDADGNWGLPVWDALGDTERAGWLGLARRATRAAEEA